MSVGTYMTLYHLHVRAEVNKAIVKRLGYVPGGAVIACSQEEPGGPVLVHVNSGGNHIAATTWLRERGWTVEDDAGYDQWVAGNYGSRFRVLPPAPAIPDGWKGSYFRTTATASRGYRCDGWECDGRIQQGARYVRLSAPPGSEAGDLAGRQWCTLAYHPECVR